MRRRKKESFESKNWDGKQFLVRKIGYLTCGHFFVEQLISRIDVGLIK